MEYKYCARDYGSELNSCTTALADRVKVQMDSQAQTPSSKLKQWGLSDPPRKVSLRESQFPKCPGQFQLAHHWSSLSLHSFLPFQTASHCCKDQNYLRQSSSWAQPPECWCYRCVPRTLCLKYYTTEENLKWPCVNWSATFLTESLALKWLLFLVRLSSVFFFFSPWN